MKNETMEPGEGGRATFRDETLAPRPERDKANSAAPAVGEGIVDFQGLRFSWQ